MARPRKKGIDYFPFDVDLFQDYKVRKLMRHQGGSQAVAVYALLLCNIYKNGYYLRWDDELPFFMSEILGLKEAYIHEVIKDCAAVGLIDKELYDKENIITSRGIQVRYVLICQLARRASTINEYNLISSEETMSAPKNKKVSSEEMTLFGQKEGVSSEEINNTFSDSGSVSSEKTPNEKVNNVVSSEGNGVSSEKTPVSSEKTPVSSEFSTQRKEKKSKYPPLPPPGENGRGGGFSVFLSSDCFYIRDSLERVQVPDGDIWEFIRICASSPEVNIANARQFVDAYLKQPYSERRKHPFWETVQHYQRLEENGRLHPMSFRQFQSYLFIHQKALRTEASEIYRLLGSQPDSNTLSELEKLISECTKPHSKINLPGRFILNGLQKCLKVDSQ